VGFTVDELQIRSVGPTRVDRSFRDGRGGAWNIVGAEECADLGSLIPSSITLWDRCGARSHCLTAVPFHCTSTAPNSGAVGTISPSRSASGGVTYRFHRVREVLLARSHFRIITHPSHGMVPQTFTNPIHLDLGLHPGLVEVLFRSDPTRHEELRGIE